MAENTDFKRQRRNLIIISLVVLFAELSGIEVKKVNVFGNEVLVDNPELVNLTIWIALFYWFLRYYVYFRSINDKGFITQFWIRMDKYVTKVGIKKMFRDPEWKNKITTEQKKRIKSSISEIHSIFGRSFGEGYRLGLETFTKTDGSDSLLAPGATIKISMEVSGIELVFPAIKATINVFINTPVFTEYILPFVIFSLPVIYWLFLFIRDSGLLK